MNFVVCASLGIFMVGIIGRKIGMTSIYNAAGDIVPCTSIRVDECVVTQVKTLDKDGYSAIQISSVEAKSKNISCAAKGHFVKAKTSPKRFVREIRDYSRDVKVGDIISTDIFSVGDFVDVSGTTKGKGFQGGVKRYGFSGVGGRTHGQHNRMRAPGSVGASSFPSRVFKGQRMAGHTGNCTKKILNLEILEIFPEKILVKGAVPGAKNGLLKLVCHK